MIPVAVPPQGSQPNGCVTSHKNTIRSLQEASGSLIDINHFYATCAAVKKVPKAACTRALWRHISMDMCDNLSHIHLLSATEDLERYITQGRHLKTDYLAGNAQTP